MASMDMDSGKRARGLETLRTLGGKRLAASYEDRIAAGGLDGALAAMAVDFAFADAWARPGLALRDRSLVIISMMIALRQTAELRSHFALGLKNGLTAEELGEVLIQATPYIGLAAMHGAYDVLKQVLQERAGQAPSTAPGA
jgi:4-carboxymuconolactone decarboxylase